MKHQDNTGSNPEPPLRPSPGDSLLSRIVGSTNDPDRFMARVAAMMRAEAFTRRECPAAIAIALLLRFPELATRSRMEVNP